MSSPVNQDYSLLPELVFDDIMLRIGLSNLESLHRCRQVCKSWNDRIMRNIWDNPSKRNLIKTRIENDWGPGISLEEISFAKWGPGISLEKISFAKWLGMYSCCTVVLKLIEGYFLETRGILNTAFMDSLAERLFQRSYFVINIS